MKNLSDILAEMEKQGFELGRLYTDKDKPPFKTNLTEGKRWKVYIQGESEPFIIGGKNERDVKELAHQMTYPTRIKIKKIVREIKESEHDEGKMAQGQLKRITELSNMIQQQFNDNTNLEEWVEAKITKAEDYLSSVFNYIRLNIFPDGGVARLRVYGEVETKNINFGNKQNFTCIYITYS